MSTFVALQTCSSQVVQAEMSINNLRQERNQCETILLFNTLPDEVRQRNLNRMRQCDEGLIDACAPTRLRAQQVAITAGLNSTLPSASLSHQAAPALPPSYYVAHPIPPISQPGVAGPSGLASPTGPAQSDATQPAGRPPAGSTSHSVG